MNTGLFAAMVKPVVDDLVISGVVDAFQLQTVGYTHICMAVLNIVSLLLLLQRVTSTSGSATGGKKKAR